MESQLIISPSNFSASKTDKADLPVHVGPVTEITFALFDNIDNIQYNIVPDVFKNY